MTLGKSPESMLNLLHFERREIALDFWMLERCRYRMIQRWVWLHRSILLGEAQKEVAYPGLLGCAQSSLLLIARSAQNCAIWPLEQPTEIVQTVQIPLVKWNAYWNTSARIWRANDSTYISLYIQIFGHSFIQMIANFYPLFSCWKTF